MNHWGKLVGGLGGLLVLGPVGAVLGLVLGHQYDRGAAESGGASRGDRAEAGPQRVGQAFFDATFAVMGRLAKADGRVSEGEIRAARSLMHQMQLSPEQVQYAIARFNEGKGENFPLEASLARLRRECGRRHDLYRAFVDIQLKVVLADGNMHASVRGLLWQICQALGVSRVELAQLEAMARAQRVFTGHEAVAPPSAAGEAYKVLGVEPDADDAAVKRAYRRLMNQHHPDKLLARGLPQSMVSVAEERTLEIRGAYDTIRRARGMK